MSAPVALESFALFAPISLGIPPLRGVSAHARRRRVRARRRRLMAPGAEASAVQTSSDLSTVSTPRWGVIPGPNDQPEPPPRARTPSLPGDFVSEELHADCARFLEAMHALAVRRGEMLGAKTGGWVPRAHKAR